MNVRNCKNCGVIFNYVTGPKLCPACKEKLEEKFQEVKTYIREHKGVGIPEVAENCEVEAGQIRQWLREGRLELSEESPIFLDCEGCGKPIRSGKYCEKCTANMARGLQDAIKTGKPEEPKPAQNNSGDRAKMRFL